MIASHGRELKEKNKRTPMVHPSSLPLQAPPPSTPVGFVFFMFRCFYFLWFTRSFVLSFPCSPTQFWNTGDGRGTVPWNQFVRWCVCVCVCVSSTGTLWVSPFWFFSFLNRMKHVQTHTHTHSLTYIHNSSEYRGPVIQLAVKIQILAPILLNQRNLFSGKVSFQF